MKIVTRARRTLIAGLVAVVCALGLMVAVVPAATAATGPIFTVMNTSETLPDGVWFRNSPHTADTNRITGLGVYKNEQVQLQCYAFGDAVGPYNDSLWYYVNNVTRPTNNGQPNVGFLNAHYINDGQNANVVDAGVPACVNNRPPVAPPTSAPAPTPAPIGKLVTYYSGLDAAGAQKARSLHVDRDLTANGTYDGRWTPSAQCMPDSNAVNFAGKDINRLAGWSLGRLGPIYALKYLKDHNPGAAARINYVIMFDPGRPENFGDCDYNQSTVQADSTLAWWLGLSNDNRLVILSGNPTATKAHQTIQTAYFPAIKRADPPVRGRVLTRKSIPAAEGHDWPPVR